MGLNGKTYIGKSTINEGFSGKSTESVIWLIGKSRRNEESIQVFFWGGTNPNS